MTWTQLSPWCLESPPYSIAKLLTRGEPIYLLWERTDAGWELHGKWGSAGECRAVAESKASGGEPA